MKKTIPIISATSSFNLRLSLPSVFMVYSPPPSSPKSVKITVRAWASTQDYWDIYWELNKTIKAKIEAAGLHIPFPHVTIVQD